MFITCFLRFMVYINFIVYLMVEIVVIMYFCIFLRLRGINMSFLTDIVLGVKCTFIYNSFVSNIFLKVFFLNYFVYK